MMPGEAEEVTQQVPANLDVTPPPFEHAGMRVWDIRSAWVGEGEVDVVIGRNSRAPGSCIYRQAWSTEKVDLFKLKDTLGVGFAHKNGLYAVVANEASDRAIMDMLSIASNVE